MLNALIDQTTLDGLSASDAGKALVEHYKPAEGQSGMFILDVGAVNGHGLENVAGLKDALAKERSNVAGFATKLQSFDGLDAAAARTAIEQLAKIGDGTGTEAVKAQIEAVTKQLEDKHSNELSASNGKVDGLLGQLRSALIDQSATAAITEAGGNVKLLLPLVRNTVDLQDADIGGKPMKVVRVLNQGGDVRISQKQGDTGPMGIDELIAEMKLDKTLAGAFAGSGGSGSHTGDTPGAHEDQGNQIILTEAEAKDTIIYRRAKDRAVKEGKTIKIVATAS